jgi:hypothetical protein
MTAVPACLNGIERICPHHSIWTGLRAATKPAKPRMAASRWLRVAILQLREDSRLVRNRRTRSAPRDRPQRDDRQTFWHPCNERDEQAERVAVPVLGIAGEIAFSDDMFQQKAPYPWAKQGVITHEKAPWHSARIDHLLREEVPVLG